MLETLRPLTLDVPAEDLAVSLLGPRWREAMTHRDPIGWTPRRTLAPADLAVLLAAFLPGVLGHDGRSERETRSGGWWLLTPPHGWRAAEPLAVAALLLTAADAALAEAMRREAEAREAADGAAMMVDRWKRSATPRPDKVGEFEKARDEAERRARDENLRAGVLSALRNTAATSGRPFEIALWALRGRDEFRLPEFDRQAIALDWLEESLRFGEISPDDENRVPVAEVQAAHALDEGPVLPWRSLRTALSALLGEPTRVGPSRVVAWSLDALDALAVLDEDAEVSA